MDALTALEMEGIVQRLETFVTALEHDRSTPTLYAFVLLAQEFAVAKNRHGDTGKVRLLFRPALGTMRPEQTTGTPR